MKRFTVMLPEEVIMQTKRAKYSPMKKRIIIESLIKETFYQLEHLNYPEKIELALNIKYWDYQKEAKQYQFDDDEK